MKKNKTKKNIHAIIFLLICFLELPVLASAKEFHQIDASDDYVAAVTGPSDETPSTFNNFKNYFSGDLRILAYGVIQEPSQSSQNPGNNFLELPHYLTYLEMRPDLRFDSKFLELSVKPRAKFNYSIWEEGARNGDTKWTNDWYVNEWLARIKARDRLFLSYGRENLQWGPSFLYSPSNPFFNDNGRSNPYMEIGGADFARLVFIPHSLWTISLIANTGKGENVLIGPEQFENIYAVKIDYSGRQNYASVIVSQRDSKVTGGFFGGLTLTDAILLYSEGRITKGSTALYAKEDEKTSSVSIQKLHEDDSTMKPVILAGGSYTFENSGALSLEYMYNDPGYTSEEADAYYHLRKNAAKALESGGMDATLGKAILSQTANTGLRFIRKNYAMLQYYQGNIKNRFEITLRWMQNFDDASGQFLALGSCSLGNHWELFSSVLINAGSNDTEFGSIAEYQAMLGLKFSM